MDSRSWKVQMARQMIKDLRPEEVHELVRALFPVILEAFPPQERADLLLELLQNHLGDFLKGLERPDRAKLLNALFPLLAQEFPLDDLDLLSIFKTPAT